MWEIHDSVEDIWPTDKYIETSAYYTYNYG